jgi:hypothetical protein
MRLSVSLMVLAASGCATDPAAPGSSENELEATLEQLAAESNSAGDADAAAGFSDGLLAVRLGVRPTELVVEVAGAPARYRAIVTGIVHQNRAGADVLRRTLLAWQGDPRPEAVLQVSSQSDAGSFGFPTDVASAADPARPARGTWVNLARRHTFVATSGSAAIALTSTGEECPSLPADTRLRCAMARYDVAIDGVFHRLPRRDSRAPDQLTRIEIKASGGVAGIVITR